MGKKKDAKQGRIPKHVGGVKLPKELRRRGEALIAQAQSEAGRAAIMQGVSVVAGIAASAAQAAAARAQATQTQPRPEAAVAEPAAPSAAASVPPGDAIAKAVTAGIDAALGRLFAKR